MKKEFTFNINGKIFTAKSYRGKNIFCIIPYIDDIGEVQIMNAIKEQRGYIVNSCSISEAETSKNKCSTACYFVKIKEM